MRAAQMDEYGGISVIKIRADAPKPAADEGQVLIEVRAASLNAIDSGIRQGYLQQMLPLSFPVTLGGDFSGVVAELGQGVSEFKIGDEVYGQASVFLGGSGTLAEFAAAKAVFTGYKPKSIIFPEAAALPLTGVSATQALIEHMDLKAGQKILVHGGAGGIGTYAIQIAKYLGAYVATTASAKDIDYVEELGADEVIDYKSQVFEDLLHDYDAVLDTVGSAGDTYARSFRVLKKGGTLVSMLEQPNEELMAQYGVNAIYQFTQPTTERLAKLAELVDQGVVKVYIDKTFPLEQISDAFSYRETGNPRGKVVVEIK
jgi:NADPH:quinone reductase-like Zn-dependent oxidoreductase